LGESHCAQFSKALRKDIPSDCQIKEWLFEAAAKGSRVALESLAEPDLQLHDEALRSYRTNFCGNPMEYLDVRMPPKGDPGAIVNERGDTLLHWIASIGKVDMFQVLATSELSTTVVNSQNKYGDTPIVCAIRAGHFEILALLISYNADASITNFTGENALHLLVNLDDGNVPAAAQLLVGARAAMDAEATAFTGNTYLEMKPFGKGCPKLRAVLFDKALVLRTLLDLEKLRDSRRLNISERTPASTQRFMLAWALRLHHVGILNVLEEYFCSSSVFHNMA
jgi:hypothetical protein